MLACRLERALDFWAKFTSTKIFNVFKKKGGFFGCVGVNVSVGDTGMTFLNKYYQVIPDSDSWSIDKILKS
jgi:hypothetical protein